MNKKIDTNNRNFVRALIMVISDARKMNIAIKTNNAMAVCFLSFQSNVSATAN